MADNNRKYLIIGCIILVLLLLAGLAYMQVSNSNNAAPTPTPTPAATPTVTPTATPGAGTGSDGNATANATATPTVTPPATASVTPTPTTTPTVTPTVSPTPSTDPYSAPGWPYYNKQYGPAQPKGTITAHIEYWEEMSEGDKEFFMENVEAGVLPGSYGTWPDFEKKKKLSMIHVPMPEIWTPIGANGYAYLGEFEYGSYTVYCRIGGEFTMWQSIVIDDSHRDWIVDFLPIG